MYLDDTLLYGTGLSYGIDAMLQIMVSRIPGIFDMDPCEEADIEEGPVDVLKFADEKAHTLLLVAGAEADQENLVKIMWLDGYGNCVWNNKSELEQLEPMCAGFFIGFSMSEAIGCYVMICNQDCQGTRYRGLSAEPWSLTAY
ncbi:hypothetical protein QQZ08_000517 [Neonectria magnoliae]|uniref:Uncharacterized protein n=1 Tax=Neonectria magnoliae TaxID=2732573 RepID=A0ABR1IHJ2_9HYPO